MTSLQCALLVLAAWFLRCSSTGSWGKWACKPISNQRCPRNGKWTGLVLQDQAPLSIHRHWVIAITWEGIEGRLHQPGYRPTRWRCDCAHRSVAVSPMHCRGRQ